MRTKEIITFLILSGVIALITTIMVHIMLGLVKPGKAILDTLDNQLRMGKTI